MNADNDLLGKPLALVVALALVSLLPFVFMSVTTLIRLCPKGAERPSVTRRRAIS